MSALHVFFFSIYPYICLAVFLPIFELQKQLAK